MGFFHSINKIWSGLDFWDKSENQQQRQDFARQDEEERRRKEREAQAQASFSQNQQQPSAPGEVFQPEKTPTNTLQLSDLNAGLQFNPDQRLQKAPLPDMEFKGITEGEGKNKTIFGMNAAWLLPKKYEKTYEVKADRNVTTNKDKYVAQFDQLHPDYQKVLVNSAKEQATKGDQAAINSLRALQETGRLGGDAEDFIEGANERLYGGLSRGLARGVDLVLPGKNTFGLEKWADSIDPEKNKTQQYTGAGQAGETFGSIEKGIVDIASIVLPQTKIDDLVMAGKAYKTLADGSKVMRIGARLMRVVPSSLAGTGIDYAQQRGRGDDPNLAQSAGVGIGLDLAADALPGGIGKLRKFFRRGTDAPVEEVIEEGIGLTTAGGAKLPGLFEKQADQLQKARTLENQLDNAPRIEVSNEPAFMRKQAEEAAAAKRAAQDAEEAAKDPLNRPAYKHKEDIQDAIESGDQELNDFVRDHPEATAVDIDVAREAIKNRVVQQIGDLQRARYGAEAGVNIPDPSDPFALAKAADNVAADVGSTAPADITKAVNVPLKKAPVEELPPPATVRTAENVDVEGNPALVSDVDRARQLADEGIVPSRGESVTAANEGAMENAAEKAAREQVTETRVAPYKDPTTGENIVLTPESVVDEITSLQGIPAARRTVEQSRKLKELLDVYKNWDERSVAGAAPNLEQLFPNLTPEGRQAVQDTLDQLQPAQAGTRDLGKIRSEERGARIARANEAYEKAGGGIEGMRAKTRALGGEYSKSTFEPVQISEAAQKEVLDDINAGTNLRDWEKFNTQRSFEKMWGTVDEAPTGADIRNIQRYYNGKQTGLGDVVAEQLRDASKHANDAKLLEQIAGAPRTAMTTFDLSAPRQAGVMMARHPIEGTKAFLNGVANAFKPKRFAKAVEEMTAATDARGVNYSDFMQSVMDLHLPSIIDASEEVMSSTPLLSKVPIYGKIVKGSDRAFSGTLSELRFNVAKNWIDNVGGVDEVMKNFNEKELRDLGEALNTLSGRGGKAGGFVDKHASILSKTLFSGRLWASRLNMLNPYWYYRLSGPARKEALSSAAAFAATAGTVLWMAGKAGAEVETDPRSANFAKIKVGNTRYDILGGLQQNIRVASQILTGTKIDSITGEEKDVTPAEAVGPFAEGKLSPLLGFAWRMSKSSPTDDGNPLTREDQYGNEINVGTEALKLGAPMTVTGSAETAQDVGSLAKGAAMNIPNIFGVGTQTYGGQAKVPTRTSDIEQAVKDKDYERAIAGYNALIERENKKKNPSSGAIEELQGKIQKIERDRDDVPDTLEAINARVQRGSFDAAIKGYEQQLTDLKKQGEDASPEKEQELKDNIKRLEITKKGKYGAKVVKLYDDTSLTEWRAMANPDSPDYDPETAGLLLEYDKRLAKEGVSLGKTGQSTKYYEAKGRGRGGRGRKPHIVTNIGTISPGTSFSPQKAISATNAQPASAIPKLQKVANYSRQLKKISVSRGRK